MLSDDSKNLYRFVLVAVIVIVAFFFFSSRRRHTRLQGDWSSDVCSSDLLMRKAPVTMTILAVIAAVFAFEVFKIGRASCRERVWVSVGAVSVKKNRQGTASIREDNIHYSWEKNVR